MQDWIEPVSVHNHEAPVDTSDECDEELLSRKTGARREIDPDWVQRIPALLGQLVQASLAARIESLERQVDLLSRRIEKGVSNGSVTAVVETFSPEPYEVKKPFRVSVQPMEGEFVATFFDANINASGDTEVDALWNLKDIMIALYERLQKESKSLGPGPARQLAVLSEVMQRTR